ncbi:MAG: 3'(2'),5'-bisphosphate nucleotidase CysQ [Rhizobiaceae bacterium]
MLVVFEALALEAGAAIMSVRAAGVHARYKDDQSPVTEADEQAEKIILAGLAAHFPDIPVVAEEQASAGHVPELTGSSFFLVDALDGTKEFVAGREDFTVNIALIENGAPVAGIVYAPARAVLYAGALQSAYRASVSGHVERRIPLKPDREPEPRRIVASRNHLNLETEEYLAGLANCATVNIGSSLKFCLLAEGSADLYPRFSRTMEWDTAAGDAVLRAAGGRTETVDGQLLAYGKRGQANEADFANPHFIARV